MRNIFIAAAGMTAALFAPPSFASTPTPIHFIYAQTGTQEQFQSSTDACSYEAKRTRYQNWGRGYWVERKFPSSIVFMNCMTDRGYTMAKEGWDTGILWILPYRPAH